MYIITDICFNDSHKIIEHRIGHFWNNSVIDHSPHCRQNDKTAHDPKRPAQAGNVSAMATLTYILCAHTFIGLMKLKM